MSSSLIFYLVSFFFFFFLLLLLGPLYPHLKQPPQLREKHPPHLPGERATAVVLFPPTAPEGVLGYEPVNQATRKATTQTTENRKKNPDKAI